MSLAKCALSLLILSLTSTACPIPSPAPSPLLAQTPFYINLNVNPSKPSKSLPTTFIPGTLYDLDLFDVPSSTFAAIASSGAFPICYFSAGTYEDWRPDAALLKPYRGKSLPDWAGEWYVDVRKQGVRDVMAARLKLAKEKGCVGVDPDNVDLWQNENGVGLTREDGLEYLKWLAEEAHKSGLIIGLKNDPDHVPDVVDDYDFAVVEECLQYNFCPSFSPFVAKGKPVFAIEYNISKSKACPKFNTLGFSGYVQRGYDLRGKGTGCL
ncbi:hypothetical protein HK097_011306 [Rhizophlyctis rosea]|uniref:alpha-galactosidase n=1 Tax=Rhizophlyctis rosea TaxID=64517 RepID=A0AAD5WZB2_9FUNG|nr:hypothetical protein HK097_011306 [Rhizophlyctis rosea]